MDFETVEDAIIAELKSQVAYLRTVETYAGELEADIEGLPLRFPAAYVAYGGSSFSAGAVGAGHHEAAVFTVFVCGRSLRGQERARKGQGGAYLAVKDVISALTDKTFGLEIEPLRPVRASLLFAGGTVAAYALEFMTGFER